MIPYKIVQDTNPASAPDNSSNLNLNMNFDILKQTLINEQGFDKLSASYVGLVDWSIIGSCILPDNTVCIFSSILIADIKYSEIGVLDGTTYKIILRDSPINFPLGFTTEHQIQAECKVNYQGDYVVYWVDGFNSDKWLNITNPQIDLNIVDGVPNPTDFAQLSLMLGFIPTKGEYIDSTANTVIGGSLTAAVYYVVCIYGDKYKNFTKPLYVSSPIPIVESDGSMDKNFIGSKAGIVTNKAISISIDSAKLNLEYDYIKVQVIKKENQVLTGWTFGEFMFKNADFTCIIDHLTNETTPESILVNLVDYKSSLTITQLDDILYKAHLKSKAKFDFQPYVNNTKVNYIQKTINLTTENFKDPNLCFYSKGFMYDEVYALYQSFVIEEDGYEYETDVYHIPGRQKKQIDLGGMVDITPKYVFEDTKINLLVPGEDYSIEYGGNTNAPLDQILSVSTDARVFHAVNTADNATGGTTISNMGYWQNENEFYSGLEKWTKKDADGTIVQSADVGHVRHHKFPEAFVVSGEGESIHPSNVDYNEVNILGVELSNIVIPTAYVGKIKQVKLYYAKRDYFNRTILGQSLLSTLNGLHSYEDKADWKGNIFNSVGNMLFMNMRSPQADHQYQTGLYPLTYTFEDGLGLPNAPETQAYSYSQYGPKEGPSDSYSGYMKMKPFDMVQPSLSVSYATHIKNLYRVQGKYDGKVLNGDLVDTDYSVGFIFDPTGNHTLINAPSPVYEGINRTIDLGRGNPLWNQYRKINNAEYVDMNIPPNRDSSTANSPYSFEMDAYNYQGEKAIWLETPTRLLPSHNNSYKTINSYTVIGGGQTTWDVNVGTNTYMPFDEVVISDDVNGSINVYVTSATNDSFTTLTPSGGVGTGANPIVTSVNSRIDGDIARIQFIDPTSFNSSFKEKNVGESIYNYPAYSSPYISNICAFKLNIFEIFDNQILCEAGVVPIDTAVSFYGGDTFTSVYAERETMNLQAWSPKGTGSQNSFIIGIHCYICQSTSNINYRYKGNNTWETFYPKTLAPELWALPVTNPEWYGYNPDYSSVNDLKQPNIAPNNLVPEQSIFPNRVIRSGVDNPETLNDNYLSFQVGDYKDFGKIKGEIQNVTNQNNKLIIKTQNALFYTLGREVINSENAESYVGGGDIFAVKPKETVSSDSYGGGIGRFSDVVTQYGYMYADTTNGIVYCASESKNGPQIDEISKEGLQIFFRSELKFKLPKQLFDAYFAILPVFNNTTNYIADWYVTYNGSIWKSNAAFTTDNQYPGYSEFWDKVDFFTLIDNISDKQGIGVHCTFDYKYRRYILHKKDFNFVAFDADWLANLPTEPSTGYTKIVYYSGFFYRLASYNSESPYYEPNGTYLPLNNYGVKIDFTEYFENKSFTMAYYPEVKAWVSLYDYYPDFLFNTVDKVYSNKDSQIFKHNSEIQNNFYYTNNINESFVEPILNTPAGSKRFSSLSFYTDVFVKKAKTKALQYLDTFTSLFVRNTWQMSKVVSLINGHTSRNAERYFNANDFRDFTRNNSDALMTSDYITQQNTDNLNTAKHWSLQKKFIDYFLIPRLSFKQSWESKTNALEISTSLITSTSADITFNIGDTIKYNSGNTILIITEIVTPYTFKYKTRKGTIVTTDEISSFDYLPNKEIHIYDIGSQSTKNIR